MVYYRLSGDITDAEDAVGYTVCMLAALGGIIFLHWFASGVPATVIKDGTWRAKYGTSLGLQAVSLSTFLAFWIYLWVIWARGEVKLVDPATTNLTGVNSTTEPPYDVHALWVGSVGLLSMFLYWASLFILRSGRKGIAASMNFTTGTIGTVAIVTSQTAIVYQGWNRTLYRALNVPSNILIDFTLISGIVLASTIFVFFIQHISSGKLFQRVPWGKYGEATGRWRIPSFLFDLCYSVIFLPHGTKQLMELHGGEGLPPVQEAMLWEEEHPFGEKGHLETKIPGFSLMSPSRPGVSRLW